MTVSIPTTFECLAGQTETNQATTSTFGTFSQQRAPTDPFYYADVDVQNIVIGSRWMLGYDDAGTFITLDSGTAVATDFTISNIPAYASSFLLELRVRKSSSAPKYEPLNQKGFHDQAGIIMYLSQVPDGIAT